MIGVLLAIVLLNTPAFGDTLRHEIDGVRGEIRTNIGRYLDSRRFDGETQLTPAQIEARYEEATAGIATAVEPFGYYQPEITGRLTNDQGVWTAHFQVDLGSPVRIRRLGVNVSGPGAEDPGIRAAWSEFPLEIGDPFSHLEYEEGKQLLEDAANRRGYLEAWFAEHEVVVDPESGSAAITLDFATGRRFRFGEVLVEQGILAPELFVNYTTFEPGEPFSYRPLLDMQRALLDSGYFERVEVEALPQLEGPLPPLEVAVRVTLAAARPQRYSAGVGYRTDIRARGSLGVELRRLNRWGHRFEADIQVAEVSSRLAGERATRAPVRVVWWPLKASVPRGVDSM